MEWSWLKSNQPLHRPQSRLSGANESEPRLYESSGSRRVGKHPNLQRRFPDTLTYYLPVRSQLLTSAGMTLKNSLLIELRFDDIQSWSSHRLPHGISRAVMASRES